jgi:hypothetical protein
MTFLQSFDNRSERIRQTMNCNEDFAEWIDSRVSPALRPFLEVLLSEVFEDGLDKPRTDCEAKESVSRSAKSENKASRILSA